MRALTLANAAAGVRGRAGSMSIWQCRVECKLNHYTRTDCGWSYYMQVVINDNELLSLQSGLRVQKAEWKAEGMTPESMCLGK